MLHAARCQAVPLALARNARAEASLKATPELHMHPQVHCQNLAGPSAGVMNLMTSHP